MSTRTLTAAVLGLVLIGAAAQRTHAGSADPLHREYLTFSAPIALPGVVLAAGTYMFEVPNAPFSDSLVRVSSKNGNTVYLTQFTRIVVRPNKGEVPHVVFGEAAPGSARPIDTWYPSRGGDGRQFIYTN